ncbi:MAG: hypothetical protein SOR59_01150 [Lachnospiraceae bacterium]|nr:hypothetical protein [Lachnospiraceae bacterium]MDY2956205.1 hypothetical protein [Lachnospiraceae bacterium]
MDKINQFEIYKKALFKRKLILAGILVLSGIFILIGIWALFFKENVVYRNTDYAMMDEDENVEKIDESSNYILEQTVEGNTMSILYGRDFVFHKSTGEADILFGNPSKSKVNMSVEVLLGSEKVAETRLIHPGFQIKKTKINADISKYKPNIYDGTILVYYYDMSMNERRPINSSVPVKIKIVE